MLKREESKLNKLIAIILIITLTAANLLIIGANFVSYAIDMAATNSNNVEFDAYFKNSSGEKLESLEEAMSSERVNLYVDISVLREGYFTGKVSIPDSNFSIASYTKSPYINIVEGNTINLNQISSGNTVTLELQVKAITENSMNLDLLNKESKVKLTGTYVNSKGSRRN